MRRPLARIAAAATAFVPKRAKSKPSCPGAAAGFLSPPVRSRRRFGDAAPGRLGRQPGSAVAPPAATTAQGQASPLGETVLFRRGTAGPSSSSARNEPSPRECRGPKFTGLGSAFT
jgi:hypothetical protein